MISYKSPSCRNEPCPSPATSGFERPGTVLRGTSQRLQGCRERMVPAARLRAGWVSCLCHLEGRHKTSEGTPGSTDGDCLSKHDDTPQNQGRGSRVPARHPAAASLTIAAFGRASLSLTKSGGNKPTQKISAGAIWRAGTSCPGRALHSEHCGHSRTLLPRPSAKAGTRPSAAPGGRTRRQPCPRPLSRGCTS